MASSGKTPNVGLQARLDDIIYGGVNTNLQVDAVATLITNEVKRAMTKWPPITNSPHHHFAVMEEEFIETRDEVFADNMRLAREEALQLAAMAIRFVLEADLKLEHRKPNEA